MIEEFSLWWRFRHWLALQIGGVHIAHTEKMLNEAVGGWRKTNSALEQRVEAWKQTVDGFINGDGTTRDLECALENGPLMDEELREVYPEALATEEA